jgi:hypothetical protein
MRLSISEVDKSVITDHNGQQQSWNVDVFDRTRLQDLLDAFRDVNGYWAKLSDRRQEAIWRCYVAMHEVLSEESQATVLIDKLMPIVQRLYDQMTFEEMSRYLAIHGNIIYPATIKDEYDQDDTSHARTYLKRHYKDLVIMSALLRPMIPIWGDFIRKIQSEAGSKYKEYVALRLLKRANIIGSIPMQRLVQYIEASIAGVDESTSAIIAGLSTADLPEWLLAMVVIRRIAVGEIDATEERGSLISNIFGFVNNTLQGLDRKMGGIKAKKPTARLDSEEESKFEEYKVKQPIAAGDIATFTKFSSEIQRVVLAIDPTADISLIQQCMHELLPLQQMDIKDHHILFCQWVLDAAIPPQAIETLAKPSLINNMIAVKVLLWSWGMHELALLATGMHVVNSEGILLIQESRGRIPNVLGDQLAELYPHIVSESSTGRSNNIRLVITKVTRMISQHQWVVTLPEGSRHMQPRYASDTGVMYIPQNLSELLARLVIRLNQ